MISNVYNQSQDPPAKLDTHADKAPIAADIAFGRYVNDTSTRHLLLLCAYSVSPKTYPLRPFRPNNPQQKRA